MEPDDVRSSTLAAVRSTVRALPARTISDIQGHVGSDDALAQLRLAGIAVDAAHDGLDAAVAYARDRGYSWSAIGAVLGITRHGAEQRFRDC
jgi:hypothetical protein